MCQHFHDNEQFNLSTKKGCYPYDYTDSWDVFEETHLPQKKKFFNYLNECNISDKDYDRALWIFDAFNCKNIGEYSNLYLKTDVLLSSDIFENFRDKMILAHGLDPVFYVSFPEFT